VVVASLGGCLNDEPAPALQLGAPGAFVSNVEAVTFAAPPGDSSPVTGQLWLPAQMSGPPTGGLPIVAFMPALGANPDSYSLLLEHIASHGFVVLGLIGVDQGRDPIRQATRLMFAIEQAIAAHPEAIDAENIALAGHSYGGKIALLAATLDLPTRDQIQTVIAWDPIDTGTPRDPNVVSVTPELMPDVRVPTLLFGTPASDCVPEGNNHDDFFAAATSPSLHLLLPTADHTDWGDDFGEGVVGFGIANQVCHRVGALNGAVLHQVARRSNVAWLKKHVNGERDMDRYLTGADAVEIKTGIVVATQK
jgi:chlorophyllase